MNKITDKFILFNNCNIDDYTNYIDSFIDWCEINDITYAGEGTDMYYINSLGKKVTFWSWFYEELMTDEEMIWDNFKTAMKYRTLNCVVTGQLGLWDGGHEIYPTCMLDLLDAVYKCLKDAINYSIVVDNKVMTIENHHHDGTNVFEIRLISGDNYDKLVCWDDDEDGDITDFFKDDKNFQDFYYEYFE